MTVTTNEAALSGDAYDSIAFRGMSAQYLAQIIVEVTTLSQHGDIYPPSFALAMQPQLENGLSLQPHGHDEGRVSPAEAVALRILADEGAAIAQNMGRGDKKYKMIQEIVGDPGVMDVVDGMANLGYGLLNAVSIREKIFRGEKLTGKTIGDALNRELVNRFKIPFELDGMSVRSNVVLAAREMAGETVERDIRNMREWAKTESDLQSRMQSHCHGIELGARIYQQVLGIAIQRGLPMTLKKEA